MMDFANILQGGKCIGCGAAIEHFGVCDKCANQFDRDRTAERRMESISTIPGSLRWATFDAPELATRVKDHAAISNARKAADGIIANKVLRVVLYGPSGVGKTSLACAILRHVIDSQQGRTARFSGAVAVALARMDSSLGGTPYLLDASVRSSCLLLDDLGQEDPRGEHAIREVIHKRFDTPIPQPQIVTTWLVRTSDGEVDASRLHARYGDGTARRVLEHAAVIEVTRCQ